MAAIAILTPLLLTIFIEFLVLKVLIPVHWAEVLFYSVLINTVTLPPATFMYRTFLHNLFLIEVLVIVTETVLIALLFSLTVRKSCALSCIANTVSAMMGILLAGFY